MQRSPARIKPGTLVMFASQPPGHQKPHQQEMTVSNMVTEEICFRKNVLYCSPFQFCHHLKETYNALNQVHNVNLGYYLRSLNALMFS